MNDVRSLGLIGALMVALVSMPSGPAAAGELLFDQGNGGFSGGFLFYTGGATPLFGSKIQFFAIEGFDTPQKDTVVVSCATCYLNFSTGNFNEISNERHFFNSGGSFTLNGSIPQSNLTGFPGFGPGDIIFDGSFTGSPGITLSTGDFGGGGLDSKESTLTDFYGLGESFRFTDTAIIASRIDVALGVTLDLFDLDPNCTDDDEETECRYTENEVTFMLDEDDSGAFVASVRSGDIRNFPAPEPGTSLLVLLGLSALVASRRRSRS